MARLRRPEGVSHHGEAMVKRKGRARPATATVKGYKCSCGGTLRRTMTQVTFFDIDFGLRPAEVCGRCGAEYLDQAVLAEVEAEVKRRGLFGLERKVSVTKSGNSLVVRIPPEMAEFAGIHYKSLLRLYPLERGRIEVEVVD